jgi:hypothetical protein
MDGSMFACQSAGVSAAVPSGVLLLCVAPTYTQVYYVYGFMLLVVLILLIVSSDVMLPSACLPRRLACCSSVRDKAVWVKQVMGISG